MTVPALRGLWPSLLHLVHVHGVVAGAVGSLSFLLLFLSLSGAHVVV